MTSLPAVLVLASGLLQADPAGNSPSTHPLTLQLSVPKDTYVAGEVIPLQVRLTSTATAPIVLSARPEVGSGLQVLLTPPDGPEIPADFRRPDIGGIPMKRVIQPGGTLGADAALSPAYLKGRDFAPPKPGRWTLRATFQDMNGIVRSNVLVMNFATADSLGKAARDFLQSPSWHDFVLNDGELLAGQTPDPLENALNAGLPDLQKQWLQLLLGRHHQHGSDRGRAAPRAGGAAKAQRWFALARTGENPQLRAKALLGMAETCVDLGDEPGARSWLKQIRSEESDPKTWDAAQVLARDLTE